MYCEVKFHCMVAYTAIFNAGRNAPTAFPSPGLPKYNEFHTAEQLCGLPEIPRRTAEL